MHLIHEISTFVATIKLRPTGRIQYTPPAGCSECTCALCGYIYKRTHKITIREASACLITVAKIRTRYKCVATIA
jgi:hypothetical protein